MTRQGVKGTHRLNTQTLMNRQGTGKERERGGRRPGVVMRGKSHFYPKSIPHFLVQRFLSIFYFFFDHFFGFVKNLPMLLALIWTLNKLTNTHIFIIKWRNTTNQVQLQGCVCKNLFMHVCVFYFQYNLEMIEIWSSEDGLNLNHWKKRHFLLVNNWVQELLPPNCSPFYKI